MNRFRIWIKQNSTVFYGKRIGTQDRFIFEVLSNKFSINYPLPVFLSISALHYHVTDLFLIMR